MSETCVRHEHEAPFCFSQKVGAYSRSEKDELTHMALSIWKDEDSASNFALAHPGHKHVAWEGAGPVFWEALLIEEGDGKGGPATSAPAPGCDDSRRRLQVRPRKPD